MDVTFLLLGAVVVVGTMAAVFLGLKGKSGNGNEDGQWPFYAKKAMSEPEQILYFRLRDALPEKIILGQVQLSRLLGVKKGNNNQAWLNRINRMSADFVICKPDSSVVAVIELDDASHLRESRVAADQKKDRALNAAGIRIIRWKCSSLPNVETIRKDLS